MATYDNPHSVLDGLGFKQEWQNEAISHLESVAQLLERYGSYTCPCNSQDCNHKVIEDIQRLKQRILQVNLIGSPSVP